MSTINPSAIDATQPEEELATTQSVRDNEQATIDQLTAAASDIDGNTNLINSHTGNKSNPHNVTAAQSGSAPTNHDHTNFDTGDDGFVPSPGVGSGTRILREDGVWVEQTSSSVGDMEKSVYDTDNNGIVDKSETLNDGVNSATTNQVVVHIASTANPHSVTAAQVGAIDDAPADTSEYVRKDNSWVPNTGGSGGEINTASNSGTLGIGIVLAKVGADLPFKGIVGADDKIIVADNAPSNTVTIAVSEADLVHDNIGGTGTNSHTQIDSHIASTANPHAVTAAQAGAAEAVHSHSDFDASNSGFVPNPGAGSGTRVLQEDGVWTEVSGASIGDMLKSVYDTNDNGSVNKSEALDDTTNISTAAEVRAHLDDVANPHAVTSAQIGALVPAGGALTGGFSTAVPDIGTISAAGTLKANILLSQLQTVTLSGSVTITEPDDTGSVEFYAVATGSGTISAGTGVSLIGNNVINVGNYIISVKRYGSTRTVAQAVEV